MARDAKPELRQKSQRRRADRRLEQAHELSSRGACLHAQIIQAPIPIQVSRHRSESPCRLAHREERENSAAATSALEMGPEREHHERACKACRDDRGAESIRLKLG